MQSPKDYSVITRTKETLYGLFDQLIILNVCNTPIIIVLIIFETLIYIHSLTIQVATVAKVQLDSMYNYLKFIDPISLLYMDSWSIYIVIGALSFGLIVLLCFVFLFIVQWHVKHNGRHSLTYYYLVKICGTLFVLMKHVLYQPIFIICLSTVRCTPEDVNGQLINTGYECKDKVHIALISLSAFIMVMDFMLGFLIVTFYSDDLPDSHLPWAYCKRLFDIYKYMQKFLLALSLFLQNSSSIIGCIELGLFTILSLICTYKLYCHAYMNNMKVYYALLTAEGAIFWINLIALVAVMFNIDWSSPVVLVLFAIVFFMTIYLTSERRFESILLSDIQDRFKEIDKIEIYSRLLLNRMLNEEQKETILLEELIAVHLVNCKSPNCLCKNHNEQSNKQEGLEKDLSANSDKQDFSISKPMKKLTMNDESYVDLNKKKQYFYRLLISEIINWGKKHENKAKFHIHLACLKLSCYENHLSALYKLMCANELSPSLYEEFLIFRLTNRIETQMIRKETMQHSSNDIDNLVKIQQVLANMQENMEETLKLFIGFWKELQDETPNFQYLGNVSHEITSLVSKIRVSYKQLIVLNPVNLYCRMLYALFLKKIVKDEFEAFVVYEQINAVTNNNRLINSYGNNKYGMNSKTALFIISGEKGNLGEVLCINNEVFDFFGYEKSEIMGYNISKIMPPIIGAEHNNFIINFFKAEKYSKISSKLVLPLHKHGYLIPCEICLRIVPDLTRGAQLIGFLSKVSDISNHCSSLERNTDPNEVLILLTNKSWELQAFNIRASHFFGILPSQANLKKYHMGEDKIFVSNFIPALEDPDFIRHASVPRIADTSLNLKVVRKVIESELEIVRNVQEQNRLISSSNVVSTLQDSTQMPIWSFDDSIKCQLTLMDFIYGKPGGGRAPLLEMKLLIGFVEAPIEKGVSKNDEVEKDFFKQQSKLKDMPFIEDNLSQSKGSNSSNNSSIQDLKNVRGFKDKIKEEQKPFFVRCFIKLGLLIFLLILAASILEYILILSFINYLDTSYGNVNSLNEQYSTLINLPNCFRTIQQIYEGDELNISEVYEDRIRAYLDIIGRKLERLRLLTNAVNKVKYSQSKYHKDLLNAEVVQFTEKPDPTSISNKSYISNYTVNIAIANYIAKGTQINQFSYDFIKAGKTNAPPDKDLSFDRLMSFMIDNGKSTLRYYAEKLHGLFFEDVLDEISGKTKVLTLVLIINPIIIVLLILLFIPFIIKVQSSLLKIYLHLCQFKNSDILLWLEICNSSAADIKASITRIHKIYSKVDFEIKLQSTSDGNKANPSSAFNSEINKKPANKEVTDDKTADDENEQFVMNKDEAISKSKQQIFSQMTRKKTSAYIVYLLFFFGYIVVFQVADSLIFSGIYNGVDMSFYLYKVFSTREYAGLLAIFFLREELKLNEVITHFEYGNATAYYVNKAFDTEMEIYGVMTKLTECKTIYSGLPNNGFNNLLINGLSFTKKVDVIFTEQYAGTSDTFTSTVLKNNYIVKSNDLIAVYAKRTFNRTFELLGQILQNWTDKQVTIHKSKFSLYIVFLIIIFAIFWNQMVDNMQMDIIKALNILNVLPTSHLGNNIEFIKDMNRSNLIN